MNNNIYMDIVLILSKNMKQIIPQCFYEVIHEATCNFQTNEGIYL